ncbi:MAG: type II toxin-antitoxin system ParD family antitoxin [Patescibacteria group bacterium]
MINVNQIQKIGFNVSLPAVLQKLVSDKLASGVYSTESEVVEEGLRLLNERDELRRIRLAEIKEKIAIGYVESTRGEVLDGNKVFDGLEKLCSS